MSMWILASIVVVALVAIVVVVLLWRRGRGTDGGPAAEASSSGESGTFIAIGFVFVAAGVALMFSIGPSMIGVMGLGAVFLVIGLSRRSTS